VLYFHVKVRGIKLCAVFDTLTCQKLFQVTVEKQHKSSGAHHLLGKRTCNQRGKTAQLGQRARLVRQTLTNWSGRTAQLLLCVIVLMKVRSIIT